MIQFYVSIIIFGIFLILVSFVWIVYDSKKSSDLLKQLDDKKEDLVGIISDAEQMVDEMNKFSDYIVTQMEIKNEELNNNLKSMEDRLKKINNKVEIRNEVKDVQKERIVTGDTHDIKYNLDKDVLNYNSDLIIENYNYENPNMIYTQTNRIQSKARDKVIPMKSKYSEVLMLSRNGFSDTEIAKRMNIGKGEIQLILEMNKIS